MKTSLITADWVRRHIPLRPKASNKGKNGHVLLVAGSRGMTGAAVLGGLGALRAGVGLLTVGIVETERRIIATRLPEALTLPLPEGNGGALGFGAIAVLEKFVKERPMDVLAIGPGLSQRDAVKKVVGHIVRSWKLPIVLDADGLNVLKPKDFPRQARIVITPHPGELGRFLGVTVQAIERNRVESARRAARLIRGVCLLKGDHTVITDGRQTLINPTGNSAMATGGMGDVLTGLIAGLVAQGLSLFDAACAGAYLHGKAGDMAAIGDRGLLASELSAKIPAALKSLR